MGGQDVTIPLTFRIGVTGHRWIDADSPAVRAAVTQVLDRLMGQPITDRSGSVALGAPVLVSCLAEGADRILARAALERGLRLEVVLPMPPAEYCADFDTDESRVDFDALLAQSAATTVVPGPAKRDKLYARAGTRLLNRCDVLVALWDGAPSAGVGGTAFLIDRARRLHIPVVDVRVDRSGGAVVSAEWPRLRTPIVSKAAVDEVGRFNRSRAAASGEAGSETWHPRGQFADHVWPYFRQADALATRYRDRLRWASRALYGLAFLAVAIVATQMVFFPHLTRLAWVEAGVLATVVAILLIARRVHVVERWTATRFLAERLRSAMFLADIGSPPVTVGIRSDDEQEARTQEWVGRALREICFSAPFTATSPDPFERVKARLLKHWVNQQIDYQEALRSSMKGAHDRLARVSIALFLASLAAAVLHATLRQPEGEPEYFAYISLVVPAGAAAITGYAAQRDYLRQERRAGATKRDLQIARADLIAATTSTQLRKVAASIDLILQGDSVDWYSVATTHQPELP